MDDSGEQQIIRWKMRHWRFLPCAFSQQQYPSAFSGDSFEQQLHSGMKAAFWPGRMQEIAPEIYFDGAHNTSGIGMFTRSSEATDCCGRLSSAATVFHGKRKGLQYVDRYADQRYVWDEMQ